MTFTPEQKKAIFKELASKTLYQVGLEFGLDKVYKTKRSITNAIYGIKREVEENPEKYGLTVEVRDMVLKSLDERKVTRTVEPDFLTQNDLKMVDLTQSVAKKALLHIDRKLSKKDLSKISITQLAQVFGITLDKFFLLTGRATENIAFKAKIDVSMSSDDLLSQLLKLRELENGQNEKSIPKL